MGKSNICFSIAICLLSASCSNTSLKKEELLRYNVLMITVDDQKPKLEPSVQTPNYDKLKEKGTVFSRAYCAAPACGPLRASHLTGLSPTTSGVYYNNQNFKRSTEWLRKVTNLPRHFKNNGYQTAHYGKIFHHGQHTKDNRGSFTSTFFPPFYNKEDYELCKEALDTTRLKGGNTWSYGPFPNEHDCDDTTRMQQDTKNSDRVIRLLQRKNNQPFFICLGLWKPHLPRYAHKRYFDMYPIEDISIHEGYAENDLADLPEFAKWIATHRGFHKDVAKRNLWRKTLQAYYTSIIYADKQLGIVIDALEKNEYSGNTVVVIVGDNGFHTGENESWSKFKLLDIATRIPLLIALPQNYSLKGKVSEHPVSLLDIYPTLIELCQLSDPDSHKLEGESLAPVLEDAKCRRSTPVISTYGKGNYAVISESYYYISYKDGSKELYHSNNDLFQFYYLVNKKEYKHIVDSMSHFLLKMNEKGITEIGNHTWDNY